MKFLSKIKIIIVLTLLMGCKKNDDSISFKLCSYKDSILDCKLWDRSYDYMSPDCGGSHMDFRLLDSDIVIISDYCEKLKDTILVNNYDGWLKDAKLSDTAHYTAEVGICYCNLDNKGRCGCNDEIKVVLDTNYVNSVRIKFLRKRKELKLNIKKHSSSIYVMECYNKPYDFLIYYKDCWVVEYLPDNLVNKKNKK